MSVYSYLNDECINKLTLHQKVILNEAISNLVDNYKFSKLLDYIVGNFDYTIKNRVFRWIEFLNTHRKVNCIAYEPLLVEVLKLFKNQRILQTQTEYQCNVSMLHFSLILKYQINLEHYKHIAVNHSERVLLCLLLLSYRPDLQKRSLKNALLDFKEHFLTSRLFTYLYVDKSMPKFLIQHIDTCSYEEFKLLIKITEGNSLRKLLKESTPISKSENALFNTQDLSINSHNDNILKRYIALVRILKYSPNNDDLLERILRYSRVFKDNFKVFENDICFWQEVFVFLVSCQDQLIINNSIREVIDYFEYMRYQSEIAMKYTINGRSFKSISRAIENWHEHQIFYDLNLNNLKWQSMGIDAWYTNIDEELFCIEELIDAISLREEGRLMKHCVFSYLNSCINGNLHIFSLSIIENGNKKKLYTMEVRESNIVQIAGKYNSEPSLCVRDIIQKWVLELKHIFKHLAQMPL